MPRARADADSSREGARVRVLRALARLRPCSPVRRAQERRSLGEAVLILAGQRGLRNLTIGDLGAYTRLSSLAFYSHFEDVEDCFAAAHTAELERLAEATLVTGSAAPDWLDGFRSALEELAARLERRPNLYRGLFVEGPIARRLDRRPGELIRQRATVQIDRARGCRSGDPQPPPITASFLLAAVENTATAALEARAPERFTAAVPELCALARRLFFGPEED